MIPLNYINARPRRSLEAVIVSGHGLLQLVKKGRDVTGKDVAQTGLMVGAQIGAILLADKLITTLVSRALLTPIITTVVAIEAAYIAGAVVSVVIDPDEGFENYNLFIDTATDPDTAHMTRDMTAWAIGELWNYYIEGGFIPEGSFEYEN